MRIIYSALIICMTLIAFAIPACADNGIDTFELEIYSDIKSCDVTIYSDSAQEDLKMDAQLTHDGNVLDQRTVTIASVSPDSRAIKVISWDTSQTEDGVYKVHIMITKDGDQLHSQEHSFVHGRQIIPKITVEDILPSSHGLSVVIEPKEPVLVDIEYMLVEGSDVVYAIEDENVPLHTTPQVIQKQWDVILVNNRQYDGRLKVRSYNPSEKSMVFMRSFKAKDDVEITDAYEDEIGASVTLEGRSQVPFEGSVRFTVRQKDGHNIIQSIEQSSPILLTGDDETIEIIWNRPLQKGIYELVIEVIGNDNDIIERKETIIEAEGSRSYTNLSQETETQESTPGFASIQMLMAAIAAIFVYRRRS